MAKILISLTGPSGVGKGYLKRYLKKAFRLSDPPVYTTRKKRKNENSSDRIFLTPREFQEKLQSKEIILVKKIYGSYYGFPKDAFSNNLNQITEIYIENVKKFREMYPFALMIGILPKDLNFLIYRLRKRSKESGEEIFTRIREIEKELSKIQKQISFFNYVYYVGEDNEDRICQEIENYLKNYINFKNA